MLRNLRFCVDVERKERFDAGFDLDDDGKRLIFEDDDVDFDDDADFWDFWDFWDGSRKLWWYWRKMAAHPVKFSSGSHVLSDGGKPTQATKYWR